MCNILDMKCEKCNIKINMHLADFATEPEEIKVYCRTHIPKDNPDIVVWDIKNKQEQAECGTTRVGILPLTDNAKYNSDGNMPNFVSAELRSK